MASLIRWVEDRAKNVAHLAQGAEHVVFGGGQVAVPLLHPSAPRQAPVPRQVVQQIQHAKYGPLAHNQARQQQFLQSDQPKPFNVKQAALSSFATAAHQVGEGIARTAPEVAMTVVHPNDFTYHPGSRLEKFAFGETPIQNIQAKVHDTQKKHGNIAGLAEGLFSVAQDAPVGFGAVKGAKVATPVVKHAAERSFETPAITELKARKAASIKAMDTAKPSMMKQHVANVNNIDRQIQAIQQGGFAKVPGKPSKPAVVPEVQAQIPQAKELQGKTLYRGTTASEWNDLQNGGKSVGRNGRKGVFVASDKELADLAVENHQRHGKTGNVIIEYKPGAAHKVTRGGSLGHIQNPNNIINGEYVAENLGLADIAKVTDENGKVIYEDKAPQPTQAAKAPAKIILKETKPRAGRQDVITAQRNPQTGKMEAQMESIQAPTTATDRRGEPVGSSPAVGQPQTPPEFLRQTGNSAKSTVSSQLKPNIELDRSVQNTLKSGTSDDAIQTVMDTTGADLQSAAKYVSRVARQSGVDLGLQDATKNPLLGSVKVPTVKAGDVSQPNLNAKFVQEHEQRIGQRALDNYNKLSPHDQVLLKDIETGTVGKVAEKADSPQAFKQAEQAIRNYYNLRHAYDRYLGIDVGYRTNYLRQIFNKVESSGGNDQISLKGSNKNPGYTKTRSQETLGSDVADALHRDIQGASFNHAKLTYEKGLNEALNGRVAKGELVRTPQDGAYVQVQNKYGQDLSVPKDIAHQINSRTWGPNASKALNRYDAINHGLKYVKLSGGFFHAFTEAGNFAGQQLASGKLISNPTATGKLFKVFFSPKAMDSELQRMTKAGVVDRAHLAGLTTQAKEILADANVSLLDKAKGAANKAAKYSGVQAIHDATFQREIPYAKLKLFEQKTQGLDINKPADLAKMRETARAINNMFGGINREVNGIKPSTFKWLQRAVLATDFTEGKWHTLYDAATHGGPAGNIARQAVVGKAILFGILASAGAAAGGEFTGKSPAQIAKNAGGNLLDPQFEIGGYTAKLPKTFISEAIDALKPAQQSQGAPWNASGLIHYATSRTAALPSEAIQLANNKDYYGQPIYGKNTKKNGGGPISPQQAGLNLLNTVAPIPFGQGVNTANGKQNIAAAAANIAGLNVRPNPANTVSFQGVSTNLTDPQRRAYQAQLNATKSKVTQQLTSSTAYKNMSPNDKANAITQLNKNIDAAVQRDFASKNGLGQYSPNFTGKGTQATVKQQQILSGKIDPNSYVKGATTTTSASSTDKSKAGTTTTINGQLYHYSATGRLVKGAPPAPKTPSTSNTTYDAKTQTWTRVTPSTGKTVQIAKDGTQTIVSPGIGHITHARADYTNNIVTLAKKYNVDPYAALSVAAMEGLGGGVGDGGTSFGPFQLHVGGALPKGKDQAWAESPAGIEYALQQISKVAGGKKGQDAIAAIVQGFEKPLDPNNEIAGALSIYGGKSANLTAGSSRSVKIAGTTTKKKAANKKLASAIKATKTKRIVTKSPGIKATPIKKSALKQYALKKYKVSKVKIA